MRSEPFWKLKEFPGAILPLTSSRSIKGFNALLASFEYAIIDIELAAILSDKQSRETLRQFLLSKYFPDRAQGVFYGTDYLERIKSSMVQSPAAVYRAEYEEITHNDPENILEERFIRTPIFKKVVLAAYNKSCCVTGLKIETTYTFSLLDACHIKSFSVSHDDTISNGVALCPTMHRAYDRGLITIDTDYKVIVSRCFDEIGNSKHSIKDYHGNRINLPPEYQKYPSVDNLKWHMDNLFID